MLQLSNVRNSPESRKKDVAVKCCDFVSFLPKLSLSLSLSLSLEIHSIKDKPDRDEKQSDLTSVFLYFVGIRLVLFIFQLFH